MIRRLILLVYMSILAVALFPAQSREASSWSLDEPSSRFASNSVGDIVYMDLSGGRHVIWVGTGNGVSQSTDGGLSWVTYDQQTGLNQSDISALAVSDTTLWVATAYSKLVDGEPVPYGKGFNRTDDLGESWKSFIPEQVDFAGKVAYDITIDDTTIWAACWYGGLIRSQDKGQTWQNVFVDSFAQKDYENGYYLFLSNRFFSVVVDTVCPVEKTQKNSINDIYFDGKFIWIATQNGLYFSSDLGKSYYTYDTSNGFNSNGVYCLTGDTSNLWIGFYQEDTTYPLPLLPSLTGADFNFTTNHGVTWDTSRPAEGQADSPGKFAMDMAITDTVIWAACGKGGLIRSFDGGTTWENVFADNGAKKRFEEGDFQNRDIFTSIAVDTSLSDTTIIWAGTEDGLYRFTYTTGYLSTTIEKESPLDYVSSPADNQVIISDTVYERVGFGHWDYDGTIMVDDACPGDFFEIPVILNAFQFQYPVSGFELEIEYDYNDLTFNGAMRGILLEHRQWQIGAPPGDSTFWSWEYFSYRVLPCPICACCKNKILLFGQSEMPDGQFQRGYCLQEGGPAYSTYWGVDTTEDGETIGASLVWLKFQVANNEWLRGLKLPLVFEWEHKISADPPYHIIQDWDCAENTMSNCDGSKLYVSKNTMQYDPTICSSQVSTILDFVDGGVQICPKEGQLSHKSVIALGIQEYNQSKILWASAYSEESGVSSCSTFESMDGGETWIACFGGIQTRDFAFLDSTVWIATHEGLKRSTNGGLNWDPFEIIDSTSGELIIPSYFTSVCVVEDTSDTIILVGSIDGLARSTNDGKTWKVTKFAPSFKKAIWAGSAVGIYKFIYNYRDVFDTVLNYNSYADNITGDWVVSLAIQQYGGKKTIWAGTQVTYSGQNGISFSTDDGDTWETTLLGDQVWNFDFDDSVVWTATSSGLKRSYDGGKNWEVFNHMKDKDEITENRIFSSEFTSVAIIDGTVWAGNADGLVKSQDNGTSWDVIQTAVPIGTPGSETAYAYPSPFSPIVEQGQPVRIFHRPQQNGSVTIRIYDFAMNLVITLVNNQYREGGKEYKEPWDGRNEKGDLVANGIYFFKVEAPGGQTEWGKLVVIK